MFLLNISSLLVVFLILVGGNTGRHQLGAKDGIVVLQLRVLDAQVGLVSDVLLDD